MKKLVTGVVFACLAAGSFAAVKPAPFYQNNMVLQRDKPIVILGTTDAGEKVTAEFMNTRATATADKDGRFRITLPAQKVSTIGATLTLKGREAPVALTNILMGDVWLCSGQSNMEWVLKNCGDQGKADAAAANLPLLRQIKINNATSLDPLPFESVKCGSWEVGSPERAGNWTAVGFYFARSILKETGVPIGLVNSSWGGTPIQAWMPADAFASNPDFVKERETIENRAEIIKQNAAVEADYKARQAATNTWLRPPVYPWGHHSPTALYNAMIYGLEQMPIRGFIWYQGENNATDKFYDARMVAMVASWRKKWNAPLPFYFVQLAAHMDESDDPNNIGWEWAKQRERQTKAWKAIPNSGMALAIDIGEGKDVHPKNKLDVGERLARWALRDCYGKKITVSGPMMKSIKYDKDTATVQFEYAENGLMVGKKDSPAPVVEDKNAPLLGFAVKGEKSGKWAWAQASIKGNTVLLKHPQQEKVIGVRYAYQSNPKVNFYNRDGLPGVPFTTD